MADPDADAQLLDRIGGKYGEEGSDYDDLGNADEDALLEGFNDPDFMGVKHSSAYQEDTEELDHEPEEPEDVLDLEAPDVELEDDVDDISKTNISTVTSTTQPELDISQQSQAELEEHERNTDKFKNERQVLPSKSSRIPDSLDAVSVPTSIRNNRSRMAGRARGGGNFANRNQMQRNRTDNKTVLINPHFKGQVKINNETRLAWDARQKINQNKSQSAHHQVGRVMPFTQNERKQHQAPQTIQPWINGGGMQPQYQPTAPPVYQPQYQAPQVSSWNQYQGNTFNQVPQQNNNNQHVFMQPLPSQNAFMNHPPPSFNQPPPQYPQTMYQNNPPPSAYPNQSYAQPPPNSYNQPIEYGYVQPSQPPPPLPNFNMPNNQQYMGPPPNQSPPFNQPVNNNRFVAGNQSNIQFRNQRQRFNRPKGKIGFNSKVSLAKRKVDNNLDVRKKKRTVALTNLHEVATVDMPDTTVKEDKPQEDEDEETKAYRRQIEEQKKKRQQILEQKELRRKLAAEQLKQSTLANPPSVIVTSPVQPQQQQSYPEVVRNLRSSFAPIQTVMAMQNSNNKVINTDSEESNYDISSFLSNRKILAKDQSLVDTSIVVVSNLAAGTTDVKLRKMCQGIGDIKKLQMSPKERQATIQFNSVASAHAFFKKYQRTMLDLSMIQVTLKPMP